jgi:hypothetical protein
MNFFDIAYTWVDKSPISICNLPGFVFDPSTIITSTDIDDEKQEEEGKKTMTVEEDDDIHVLKVSSNRMKQLSLCQFLEK